MASGSKRSRSTIRTLPTDHHLSKAYLRNGSIGPSRLLQESGSKSSFPKVGDYHHSLTTKANYVKPSPQDYNVPQLFDNYKKEYGDKACVPGLRQNPQYTFGRKDVPSRVLSKELLLDNLGIDTPGVGQYIGIRDGTFEAMKRQFMNQSEMVTPSKYSKRQSPRDDLDKSKALKLEARRTVMKPPQLGVGTFSTSTRFGEPQMQLDLKKKVPSAYRGVSPFGKSPSKA